MEVDFVVVIKVEAKLFIELSTVIHLFVKIYSPFNCYFIIFPHFNVFHSYLYAPIFSNFHISSILLDLLIYASILSNHISLVYQYQNQLL